MNIKTLSSADQSVMDLNPFAWHTPEYGLEVDNTGAISGLANKAARVAYQSYTFWQQTASARPALVTDNTFYPGAKCVRFSTGKYLTGNTQQGQIDATEWTLAFVLRPTSFAAGPNVIFGNGPYRFISSNSNTGINVTSVGSSNHCPWNYTIPTDRPLLIVATQTSANKLSIFGSWNSAAPEVVNYTNPTLGISEITLGAYTGGGVPFAGNINQVLTFDRGLTWSEQARLLEIARTHWGVETFTATNLVIDGDSITYGYPTGNSNSWASIAATNLGWTSTNLAANSSYIGAVTNPTANSVAYRLTQGATPAVSLAVPAAKRNLYLCMIGVNDLPPNGYAPGYLCAAWEQHMLRVMRMGFTLIAATLTPYTTGGYVEPQRQVVNEFIRAFATRNPSVKLLDWDVICPIMVAKGQNLNRTYYISDDIHPTTTGQGLLAAAAQAQLAAWFP